MIFYICSRAQVNDSIYHALAIKSFDNHRYKTALKYFEKEDSLLSIATKDDEIISTFKKATCMESRAHCYLMLKDFENANQYYHIAILIEENKHQTQMAGKLTEYAAEDWYKSGYTTRAIELYSDAIDLYKQIPDNQDESLVLDKIGDIYSKEGNKEKASIYYQKSIEIKTK